MATVESDLVLIVKRRLPVARDLVYKAWTTPESLRQWHAPGAVTCVEAEIDLRVGGRYRIAMKSPDSDTLSVATGEYREIVPNERLVYTWQWETDTNGVGETLVTINFRPLPTGSELELIHERFVKTEHRDDHTKGWTAIMEKLDHLYQAAPQVSLPEGIAGPALVEYYLQQTDFASFVRDAFILANVSDDQSLWRPHPLSPPIAWHVAHIAVGEACAFLGMAAGQWDAIPQDMLDGYRMGAELPSDVNGLPPLSEVLPRAKALREQSRAYLRALPEEGMREVLPHRRADQLPEMLRTPEDCLRTLPVHEAHHTGEISCLVQLSRRMGGFE